MHKKMATGLETLRRNAPDYSGSVAIKSCYIGSATPVTAAASASLRVSTPFDIMYYRKTTF